MSAAKSPAVASLTATSRDAVSRNPTTFATRGGGDGGGAREGTRGDGVAAAAAAAAAAAREAEEAFGEGVK